MAKYGKSNSVFGPCSMEVGDERTLKIMFFGQVVNISEILYPKVYMIMHTAWTSELKFDVRSKGQCDSSTLNQPAGGCIPPKLWYPILYSLFISKLAGICLLVNNN